MYRLLWIIALWAPAVLAEVEIYGIDSTHSFANWSIRHVVSKTSGTFHEVRGKIVIDRANLENSSVEARISVLSVNSNHAKRDAHLLKDEYLDAVKFPEMRFSSTRVEARGTDAGMLTGKLALHGVEREMTFPFKILGFGTDPWGGQRMGVEAHLALRASDFGFPWPRKPGAPVGDDIEITLLIEGVKNSPDYKPW